MDWEKLCLKKGPKGSVIVQSLRTGNNLQCCPDGKLEFNNKNELLWEQWNLLDEGGHFFLESRHTGNVLQVQPDGQCKAANKNKLGWEQLDIHLPVAT